MLDDGRRQRREQVLLDRALQRPRAHLRREAALEQELERRRFPLDRPLAVLAGRGAPARAPAPWRGCRASARATAAGTRSTLSSRLTNSGRKVCADRAQHLVARERRGAGREAEARAAMAGRAEVRGEDDDAWRKSATWPRASVSRPSSNTCRNRSQTLGCAFSNSSSSTTENGCLRTRCDERARSRAVAASPRILARRLRRLELAHVEPDHALRRAEQELGERLRELGLAGAGRAGEQEHRRSAGPDR